MMTLKVDKQEFAAIIAGLRCLQEKSMPDRENMDHFYDTPVPTDNEIDALCERLNLDSTVKDS